jgi:hypothetical protein
MGSGWNWLWIMPSIKDFELSGSTGVRELFKVSLQKLNMLIQEVYNLFSHTQYPNVFMLCPTT